MINPENNLKDHEKEAIEKLRERLKDDMESDMYDDDYLFLRFLKARDFNIDNAETMLRKHLQWREKYDIKNALKVKKSKFMEKYLPNHVLGYDKEGCVVRFCPVGNVDFAGCIASVTFEDFTKFVIHEIEEDGFLLKKQSKLLGRNVDRCLFVYDFQNLQLAQATNKKNIYYLIYFLNVFVNNSPERMKGAYLLNVPMYFSSMYAMLKSFLPNTVLKKIHMFSDDSFKEVLLKLIDADELPAFLGGNKTDPDGNPLCLTFLPRGERVPESCYLLKNKRSLAKAPGAQKVTLTRAAFHEVNLDVKEAGSYLEWEFETKCRDIGFGLFYQDVVDGEEKITEIISIQRIDTEYYPETGTFRCDAPGTYVIVFDNTYSWVRSKEIYFRTKIVTPNEHESSKIKE